MIITFANYKGGVAKTESTYRIGIQFAQNGFVPWLVDTDPQANLTRRCNARGFTPQIGDVLGGAAPPSARLNQAAHRIELAGRSAQIIPSHITLENVALGLLQRNFNRLSALANAIQESRHFLNGNPVLIDTPPNAGILMLNALVAANYVVICAEPEEDAIAGVKRICEIVGQICQERGTGPAILGTIATRVNSNLIRHKTGLEKLSEADMPRLLGQIPLRAGATADSELDAAYSPIAERIWRLTADVKLDQ